MKHLSWITAAVMDRLEIPIFNLIYHVTPGNE